MANSESEDSDLAVEANWYDEFGGALESVAAQYRRAAGVLRLAGRVLPASELDDLRRQLGAITRRVFDATAIGADLARGKGSVER